ncbi:hypothetical protein A3C18_00540 [Candidatus Kaiserbacteria bacterium RIFCSPHIGHO2_02_FULL_54_11b]|uniref:Type 4 fimbrial biogenesis protein PilX N-terminal domain-containing protein n=2 Tax=Candidatus Kaiseribacteriota TaxID=1752734 RepID=A0A1F6CMP6_9BACT|nr:MAG: hypothetical protein A2704_05715 [Candidatus Kaiserbacteria bacterium RIFCSPHIGHO2_01_FULL_54_36b]OGG65062.1 MAG: hypothetical protein A3C18_00540 [Candidatus Kaiserbacteria bacterium RIFCSPHIGHO2_02_FULL_54_11b]
MKNFRKNTQRGFTLLLAALVSSVVLAVGAAIFSIAQKQVTLSALGRDSQFAFYAADTIAECALYWDFRFEYFASTTPTSITPKCDAVALNFVNQVGSSYPYVMTSEQIGLFSTEVSGELCAQVSVTKCQGTFEDGDCQSSPTAPIRTIIHADGYSTSCASILSSTRALQRSVELRY